MIKKYISDTALISVFTLLAFVAADKPEVDHKKDMDVPSYTTGKKGEDEAGQAVPSDRPGQYKNLETRNIFAMDGSYGTGYYNPYNQRTSPGGDAAYGLIGILRGSENMAVFRDPAGSIVSLKIGQKLADGAKIIHISQLYVKVKKGRNIKQYKIFDVNRQKTGKDS